MLRVMQVGFRDNGKSKSRFLPLAVLAALLLAVYWQLLVFPGHYVWFDHWDMCQLEIPRAAFVANSIQHGHFPLWDPHVWGGLPVLGSGQPGPLFPLTLLLETLPLQHGKIGFIVLNGVFFLQRLLMGYLALLFFREIGIEWWAAAIGGALFSAGGYVGSLPWLDISNAVVCVPAIALFAIRLSRDPRSVRDAALLGLWLGLCWVSGHHEIPLIATYALLGFMLWRGLRRYVECRRVDRGLVMLSIGSLLLGAAISAVQTLPLLEFGRQAKRWAGLPEAIGWARVVPYEIHQRHSILWRDLLTVLYPGATPESHTTMFLGATVTTMALWGLLTTWRSKVTQGLAFSAGLALLYALGGNTPFQRILYHLLPAIDKARTPARGLFIFALAAAGLAAIGLAEFVSDRLKRRPFLALAAGVLLAAAAIAHFIGVPRMYGLESSHYLALALAGTLLLGASCVPKLPRSLRALFPAAAMLMELTTVTSLRVSPVMSEKSVCAADLYSHDALVDSLRGRANGGRFALQGGGIRTSLGDLYQVDQFASFVAGVPASILDLDVFSPRTEQLLGVTLTVSGERPNRSGAPMRMTVTDRRALPPAWVSHSAIRVESADELRAKIADASIPLPGTAIVLGSGAPMLSGAPISEPVAMERPDPDHLILRVKLESRGLVTVSGVDYPGWKATVDGKAVPIIRTYGAFRGVIADAGPHVIEMRFWPDSVLAGGVLSALGLAAVCGILLAASRISAVRGTSGSLPA